MRGDMYSGCHECPVKDCQTDHYRGSACSAQRARAGVDYDPKTEAEVLRGMSDMVLREFLFSISAGNLPWCDQDARESKTCAKGRIEGACKICLQMWLGSVHALEQKGKKKHA